MITRNHFTESHPNLSYGATVYSTDGEKLGTISALEEDHFVIQKGFFFPKDFTARYDDITDVRDEKVIVNRASSDLHHWRNDDYAGWGEYDRHDEGLLATDRTSDFRREDKDVRVPIVEEELEARKVERSAGEVRLRKVVHTEMKQITVPVRKEEIIVERVPVTDQHADVSADAFDEKTIKVPLMEEEVEITKRPVVREEVLVKKEVVTGEKTFNDEVRKEDVVVERDERSEKRRAS